MRQIQRTAGLVTLAVLTVGWLGASAQQPRNRTPADARLSGTYDLDQTRGGNPQRVAEAATRSLPMGQRDRAYQRLLARLEPPQRLSIERDGRAITMASNRGPRSEFDADGRTHSERGQDGRMVSTRAEIAGNQLRVSTTGGGRDSDYSVTFEPQNNGANLRVTRRLNDLGLARPITFQSYYRRTALEPRWDVYDDSGPGFGRGRGYARGRGNAGRGAGTGSSWPWLNVAMNEVPDGMRLAATLDTPLSMRTSRNGAPFTMTVRSAGEFQNARIEGVVSRVSAERGNDLDLRMEFQRIELRGRSVEFDAVLNTIRLSDGTLLRLNDEGDVRESSGGHTVRNAAIGAAVGAVIGAVIGGGKGAAIGAAGGGVGGVILSRGHEQLDVPRGAEVTLTAVSPYRAP